jgi:hypothetical protein
MPKVWKTLGLRDGRRKRFNVIAATASEFEDNRYLHGMRS